MLSPVFLDFECKVYLIMKQFVIIKKHHPSRAVAAGQHAAGALEPLVARYINSGGIGAGCVRSEHCCIVGHLDSHFIDLQRKHQQIAVSPTMRNRGSWTVNHRVDKLQPRNNFMLSPERDLQPVGAAFLQNKWPGLQITDFALVAESVHNVTSRPVLELQTEFGRHNLRRSV